MTSSPRIREIMRAHIADCLDHSGNVYRHDCPDTVNPDVWTDFLYELCRAHVLVLACEGCHEDRDRCHIYPKFSEVPRESACGKDLKERMRIERERRTYIEV